jgi:hypothetical protein
MQHSDVPSASTFQGQLNYFLQQFEDGFAGAKWQRHSRGALAARRLKRHRDLALEEAQAKLSRSAMDARLSDHQHPELWQDFVQVAGNTDLVNAKGLASVSPAEPREAAELTKALRHCLYGEGPFEARFQRFLSACQSVSRGPVSWPLLTLAPALLFPDEHVCVQLNVFREQARWMAPRLLRSGAPSPATYARFLEMARLVSRKLAEAGIAPRDLLDVTDFMQLTTSPRARKAVLGFSYEARAAQSAVESGPG